MNASNSALFPRTQEDVPASLPASMFFSTPTQPQYEFVTIRSEKAELEANISHLPKAVCAENAQIKHLDHDATMTMDRTNALDERLMSPECERAGLKERFFEFEGVKVSFQRLMHSPESAVEELSRKLDERSRLLQGSREERTRLDKCLAFTKETHAKEVEDLKKAASESEKACWALTKYYHDENSERLAAQQRAGAAEESMALEIEQLKEKLAASKEEVDNVRFKDAEYWDTLWSKYDQGIRDKEAAEMKAERLDKQLDQWLAHYRGLDESHHKALDDQDTWHAEEMAKLKTSYKEKRKEALADLKEEYEKKNAALLARNTGLEVQVSQLQEAAKLHQAAISSLGHRHSVAKEALRKEMEQVTEFRDKFYKKAHEYAKLNQKHNVELLSEKRNAADAASKAEKETKKYVGRAESRADGFVVEKEELKARLASTNDRLTNVYLSYKALQVRYSKDIEKEQDGRAQERKMAEARTEKCLLRLGTKKLQLWELAQKFVKLEKELEVQKKGDFGVEPLDEKEGEQQPDLHFDVPVDNEREGETDFIGSGWETDDDDSL